MRDVQVLAWRESVSVSISETWLIKRKVRCNVHADQLISKTHPKAACREEEQVARKSPVVSTIFSATAKLGQTYRSRSSPTAGERGDIQTQVKSQGQRKGRHIDPGQVPRPAKGKTYRPRSSPKASEREEI